jgi:hypothetical protein
LHERAVILIGFPRRSLLTRTQADYDLAETHRLARFQFKIARLSVPLVKQADDSDAFRHRSS